MSDIRQWLQSLELDEYADAFEENRVDLSLISNLDHTLLKEIGVTVIGDHSNESTHASRPSLQVHPGSEAERRHLTVLFCDLVGSTALSESMDPEQYRDVLTAYQSAAAAAVQRYDGYIARYMGDGLLVYFGYPQAHEDDAERAIRTGLHIIDRVAALSVEDRSELHVRIGVSTGLVVVGDIVGEGASEERAVVGDTPNLAARLQSVAEADTVYLSDSTRRLVAGQFECEDLGARALKGFSRPVRIWRLVRERAVDSRFEARVSGPIAQLFGREHELGLILDRWRQSQAGEGQVVFLSGEAGIGKSRITRAVLDCIADDDHTRVVYQCSPYHTDSALHPSIEQLRRAAGFGIGDRVDTQLGKLEDLLRQGMDEIGQAAPLVAALLGLDGAARYGVIQMTPQQQRQRTLQALSDQLLGLASKKPCLFVVEDAHWIDPTTLELLQLCIERIARARVLVLVTARPTFEHQFGGHPIVTQLALNRLGRPQTLAIIGELTGGRSMPQEVLEAIASKTDGVPLFVEELTKTVLESGFLHLDGDAYVLTGSVQSLTIPASLHDSLMARLDRLDSVKEVAQTAACIGREFDYQLLSKVSPLSQAELGQALTHLGDAELIFRRGNPPDARYMFKHALVQDAAYESLLKSRRQQIHGRLVAALVDQQEVAPEILAYHAEAAGFLEQAVGYWQQAGEAGLARSANQEAVAHFSSAIRLTRSLGDEVKWKEKELELQVALGQALIATKGYAASETADAFNRGLELAEQVGSTPFRIPALYGRWAGHYVSSAPTRASMDEFSAAANDQRDTGPRVIALRMRALEEIHSGNFPEAVQLVDETLRLYVPDQHNRLALQYGHDPRAAGLIYKRWLLWILGYPDRADATGLEALEWAEEVGHANTLGIVRCWGLVLPEVLQRRPVRVAEQARIVIELADEHLMPLWRAWSLVFLGWAKVQRSAHQEGLEDMRRGLDGLDQVGAGRFQALVLGLYAEANSLAGKYQSARRAIEQAFESLARTHDIAFEADLYRIRADVLRREGVCETSQIRADLDTAVEIARQQQSKTLELRATLGLARLWMNEADGQRAFELVEPIYEGFTEGFDTPDMKEAKMLLEELS
jgi:class 3 adenylate cyclase/predicted ATPase